MADQNNYTCTGRLGRDPECKYTQAGKAVCTLSVAVQGIGEDNTFWLRAVAWEKTAEVANQYLSKGSRVALSGRLQERKWEDQEGNERRVVELVVRDLTLLDPKIVDPDETGGKKQQPRRSESQPKGNNKFNKGQRDTSGWGSSSDSDPDLSVDGIPF